MISTDAQLKKTGKNIGLLTKCQLKKKLNEVTRRTKSRTTPKRNHNGKQGVGRTNNYKYIPFAPRKKCYNCGNCNHLAIDCRKNKKKQKSIHRSDVAGKTMKFKQDNPVSSLWKLLVFFEYFFLIIMIFMKITMIHFLNFINMQGRIKLVLASMSHVRIYQLLIKLIALVHAMLRRCMWLRTTNVSKGSNKCGFLKLQTNHFC